MVRVRGLAAGLLRLRGGGAGFQVAVVVGDGITARLLGGRGRSRLLFGGLLLVCIRGRPRVGFFRLPGAGGLGVRFVSASDVAFGIHPGVLWAATGYVGLSQLFSLARLLQEAEEPPELKAWEWWSWDACSAGSVLPGHGTAPGEGSRARRGE